MVAGAHGPIPAAAAAPTGWMSRGTRLRPASWWMNIKAGTPELGLGCAGGRVMGGVEDEVDRRWRAVG
jgi:hypothetical protein